jgi:hypothetical protein
MGTVGILHSGSSEIGQQEINDITDRLNKKTAADRGTRLER